jgi:hypothetical protein
MSRNTRKIGRARLTDVSLDERLTLYRACAATDQARATKRRKWAATGALIAGALAATGGVVKIGLEAGAAPGPHDAAATILRSGLPEDKAPVSVDSWLTGNIRHNTTAEGIAVDAQTKIRVTAMQLAQGVVRQYLTGKSRVQVDRSPDPRTGKTATLILTETGYSKDCHAVQTQIEVSVADDKPTALTQVSIGEVQTNPLDQPSHTVIMWRNVDGEGNATWQVDKQDGITPAAPTMSKVDFRQVNATMLLNEALADQNVAAQ